MTHRYTRLELVTRNWMSGVRTAALAYGFGYLAVFGSTLLNGAISIELGLYPWQSAGWPFYGAHRGPLRATFQSLYGKQTGTEQLLRAAVEAGPLSTVVPVVVYKLVPILLLVTGGYLVYRRSYVRDVDLRRAAAVGSVVAVGYLPLSVLGSILLTGPGTLAIIGSAQWATAGTQLGATAVAMGVVYPVLFGGLGGVLANYREGELE